VKLELKVIFFILIFYTKILEGELKTSIPQRNFSFILLFNIILFLKIPKEETSN
jgi:hypothetical protein